VGPSFFADSGKPLRQQPHPALRATFSTFVEKGNGHPSQPLMPCIKTIDLP
jgi:hypothetical protein